MIDSSDEPAIAGSGTEPTRRRRRAPGDQTRRALLDAAVAIWSEAGIENVTMHEVARRAGKTRGTVYHHFAEREALLAATRQHLDDVLGMLFSDEHEGHGDPFQLVPGLAADNPEVVRSYVRGMLDGDARQSPLVQRGIRYFKSLHAQGRLHPGVDPSQAALSVLAMWFAAILSVSMGATASERRAQAKLFTSTFRHVVFRSLVVPRPHEYPGPG